MIAVRQMTETETAAINQRRAFRAKIEARAAALADPRPAPLAVVIQLVPEAMPAETDPPRRKWWFELLGLAANTVSIRQIQMSVASEFEMPVRDLASPRRIGRLVVARQIAMMLCKDMIPTASYPQIGRKFGGRDHTTVLHACRVAPRKVAASPELQARVDRIRADLRDIPHEVAGNE